MGLPRFAPRLHPIRLAAPIIDHTLTNRGNLPPPASPTLIDRLCQKGFSASCRTSPDHPRPDPSDFPALGFGHDATLGANYQHSFGGTDFYRRFDSTQLHRRKFPNWKSLFIDVATTPTISSFLDRGAFIDLYRDSGA